MTLVALQANPNAGRSTSKPVRKQRWAGELPARNTFPEQFVA